MSGDAGTSTEPESSGIGLIAAAALHAELLALESLSAAGPRAGFLGWLLDLPDGIDPAAAAQALLDHQQRHPIPALSEATLSLLRVLRKLPEHKLDHCRSIALAGRAGRRRAGKPGPERGSA